MSHALGGVYIAFALMVGLAIWKGIEAYLEHRRGQ
jgi:hypothetical protein